MHWPMPLPPMVGDGNSHNLHRFSLPPAGRWPV